MTTVEHLSSLSGRSGVHSDPVSMAFNHSGPLCIIEQIIFTVHKYISKHGDGIMGEAKPAKEVEAFWLP